jgi:hypothetical protein
LNEQTLLANLQRRRNAASSRLFGCLATCGLVLAGAASADPAQAPLPSARTAWGAPALVRATPVQLQAAYLDCEQQAMTSLLDFGSASQCSMVYEAVKERVFGGDFQRLLAWSRQQRTASR